MLEGNSRKRQENYIEQLVNVSSNLKEFCCIKELRERKFLNNKSNITILYLFKCTFQR